MKKKVLILLSILLFLSLTSNALHIYKDYKFQETLFTKYKEYIIAASSTLEKGVAEESRVKRDRDIQSAMFLVSKARELSEIIGEHSGKYSLKAGTKVYFDISYEMGVFMESLTYSENPAKDLESISEAFKIYAKYIKNANLKDIEDTKQARNKIHIEIANKNLYKGISPILDRIYN